jgi:hypothetical protein
MAVFYVKGTRHVTLLGRDPQVREPSPSSRSRSPITRESAADHRPDLRDGANPVGYAVREIPENGQAYGPISFSLLATDPDGVTYIHGAVLRLPEPRAEHPADVRSEYDGVSLPPAPVGTWRSGDGDRRFSPGVPLARTVVACHPGALKGLSHDALPAHAPAPPRLCGGSSRPPPPRHACGRPQRR